MTTSTEFVKAGITGQTFREITEKFGKPWNVVAVEDPVMANFALGFAWYREREHLTVAEAFDKAMQLTTATLNALFEDLDESKPEAKAEVDFVSPPPATTP